ncbi:MAG: recombinase family protein [Oligosphaeraceae bacterium]|nr:recombinase family protein [Oligosphaeraceae bacterium]
MYYGYIRVSTDKQTVENQRFEINRFCLKTNIGIDVWIEETISGSNKQLAGKTALPRPSSHETCAEKPCLRCGYPRTEVTENVQKMENCPKKPQLFLCKYIFANWLNTEVHYLRSTPLPNG